MNGRLFFLFVDQASPKVKVRIFLFLEGGLNVVGLTLLGVVHLYEGSMDSWFVVYFSLFRTKHGRYIKAIWCICFIKSMNSCGSILICSRLLLQCYGVP